MRYILVSLFLGLMLVPVGIEMFRPDSRVPWWYNGNELDWKMDHRKTPVGYDEVSDQLIQSAGITFLEWDRNQMWCYSFDGDRRTEWVGDKLLVRMVDGKGGFFDGGGQVHPPLDADPRETASTLQSCLSYDDDGIIEWDNYNPGPTVADVIEASGGRVVHHK